MSAVLPEMGYRRRIPVWELPGVLDEREMLARLYDPGVLPLPKVDGRG